MRVSCNFFAVYGLPHALLGRVPSPADCDGSQGFVVLSEEVWRARFEADAQIAGKTIAFDGENFPVIGVVPANFPGQLRGPGYWMPGEVIELRPAQRQPDGAGYLVCIGKPAQSAAPAAADVEDPAGGGAGPGRGVGAVAH